uniref:Gda-1 protein n=1 Tax=Pisum sativum TaxID=3888 RepID=O49932_PEA|nr:gda-1 [Pisum sativum]
MQEDLKRQLFGLPPRYRDSVRAITPGLPLFLYNYTTHQLHGIFEATCFGGSNIDPTAWEDKKMPKAKSKVPSSGKNSVSERICTALERKIHSGQFLLLMMVPSFALSCQFQRTLDPDGSYVEQSWFLQPKEIIPSFKNNISGFSVHAVCFWQIFHEAYSLESSVWRIIFGKLGVNMFVKSSSYVLNKCLLCPLKLHCSYCIYHLMIDWYGIIEMTVCIVEVKSLCETEKEKTCKSIVIVQSYIDLFEVILCYIF